MPARASASMPSFRLLVPGEPKGQRGLTIEDTDCFSFGPRWPSRQAARRFLHSRLEHGPRGRNVDDATGPSGDPRRLVMGLAHACPALRVGDAAIHEIGSVLI